MEDQLMSIIASARQELSELPDQRLRTSRTSKDVPRYYYRAEGDPRWTYISTQDPHTPQKLAQREYWERVLLWAERLLRRLNSAQKAYEAGPLDRLYSDMPHDKRILVQPVLLPDDQFITNWRSQEFTPRPFSEPDPNYYSQRGERVRSKSEMILADRLNTLGIPYRYEAPLYLKGYGTIHPDFTILDVVHRQEIYLEHFGLLDDSDYLEKALKKIRTYERNGFMPGDRLLITGETRTQPLDIRLAERMICARLGI